MVLSRDVKFNELDMPYIKAANDPINATDLSSIGTVPFEVEDTSDNTIEHTLAPCLFQTQNTH